MSAETAGAVFPAETTAPSRARHLVHNELRAQGFDGTATTAALLTSELATNAVLHTGEAFTVTISMNGRCARIAVSDLSNQLPIQRVASLATPGGHGLRIVDAMADRWGVETRDDEDGKIVWFEIVE